MELSYFNARVRGFKGGLLKGSDYESFLKLGDGQRYFEGLKSTPYGPYMEVAGARYSRPDDIIPEALRANLSDTLSLLWKIAPSEALPLLKAVVSVWEVYTLKAIIRGIARGIKRDEMLNALVPAGEFDRSSVKDLLSSRDLPDLIRFLDTWGSPYAKPLKAGLGAYIEGGHIIEMELNVDLFIFKYLLSTIDTRGLDGRIIRDFTILRIDLHNILTLFKVVGEGFTKAGAGDFFIEGGVRIRKKDFLIFSALKKRDDLIGALSSHIRDGDIKEALASVDPSEVGLLGEMFDRLAERRLAKLSVVEPLSIAVAASFIFKKVREIKNLRLLSRGSSFGIPDNELRRLLL